MASCKQLAVLLEKAIKHRKPVLITGSPGVGKSDVVMQAAAAAKAELIISHPVVSEPVDYKGLPWVKEGAEEATFLPFGDLAALIKAKKPTVYFLDDLGQAPKTVQAAAMQLLLARRINGHKVADCVTFIAATNRKQDKAGVEGILEPVKSRFTFIVELQSDVDSWTEWALEHDVPTELVAFIRFRPALLHDFKPAADITNSPCPRTVVNAGEVLKLDLPEDLEYEALCGAAGIGFATELVAFLKIVRQLPSPDAVLMQPDTAVVPTGPATLYALCGALARKASEQTSNNLFRYANRLPDEFSVLLAKDSLKREPKIVNSRGYIVWASKHKDVLV
jgi:hypothetical protein